MGTRSDEQPAGRGAKEAGQNRSSQPVTPQQAVGSFLREARRAQRLTQNDVASMTERLPWKISRAAVSAIERGQNFPGMEAMLALADVLFVDPKELVERARLSTQVPVDVTDLSYDELDSRASRRFWAGEFREALAIYDAMLEKLALEDPAPADAARRLASLEVRRATALKRAGALLAAIGRAEHAVSASAEFPDLQAEAYIVLADVQCVRGHLPLASDAARRAVELSAHADPRVRSWAWMVKARVRYLAEDFTAARSAFEEARRHAELAGDRSHLSHIEGDIGLCHLELGDPAEARTWIERALRRAREQSQPALEASWLVVMGRLALLEGDAARADERAKAALRLAKPRQHHVTIFRAEWLRHLVAKRIRPARPDRRRLDKLRRLFLQLAQYEGVPEIREFREALMTPPAAGRG